MKTANMIFSLILFLLLVSPVMAQNPYSCPDNSSHPMNDSHSTLELFLNSEDYKAHRIAKGLNSLQNSSIEPLTDSSYSCYRLNSFKSQHMTTNMDTEYSYYKVSNYYFIVSWFTVNSTKYQNVIIFNGNYNFHSISLM